MKNKLPLDKKQAAEDQLEIPLLYVLYNIHVRDKHSSREHTQVTPSSLASNTQSEPDFASSFGTRRARISRYATSLQNTIWLQGMILTSRRQSIPSCTRMRLEMEESKSWLD